MCFQANSILNGSERILIDAVRGNKELSGLMGINIKAGQ